MASVTLSGFNTIDFNVVLTAIMQQESEPLTLLQSRQTALESQKTAFGTLVSRVSALDSAVTPLASSDGWTTKKATSSDSSRVAASAGSSAVAGHYDVVVGSLARAQVTASDEMTIADLDATVVAGGGWIDIGGERVDVLEDMTLPELVAKINGTADVPAGASIVQVGTNKYRLVLTGASTGEDHGFVVDGHLIGGAVGVTFLDTIANGNAVDAADAELTVNEIDVKSATNTVTGAIPGVTLTLAKDDAATTVSIDVTGDGESLKTRIRSLVTAYNNLVKFTTDQTTASSTGEAGTIGHEPVVRGLRNALRDVLTGPHAVGEGAFTRLAEVGIGFDRAGHLTFDETRFDAVVEDRAADVETLFAGTGNADGAFTTLATLIDAFTSSDGYLASARTQVDNSLSRMSGQIDAMQMRLALRRDALQREFTAADQALAQLKTQSSALSSYADSLLSF